MHRLLAGMAVTSLFIAPALAGDEEAIRHLMTSTFDKPEARLVIAPVAVLGDHAIAGWTQADTGGRALLRRRNSAWTIVLCSGDGIRSAAALGQAGVPAGEARALSSHLAEMERGQPPERLALFAKFDGTLVMDAAGGHPNH
jgi:hypothetical protein